MPLSKPRRIGAIVMAAAICVLLLSAALSECHYCLSDASFLVMLWNGTVFDFTELFSELGFYGRSQKYELMFRYALVFCVTAFSCGVLIYIGAIRLRNKSDDQDEGPRGAGQSGQ